MVNQARVYRVDTVNREEPSRKVISITLGQYLMTFHEAWRMVRRISELIGESTVPTVSHEHYIVDVRA